METFLIPIYWGMAVLTGLGTLVLVAKRNGAEAVGALISNSLIVFLLVYAALNL